MSIEEFSHASFNHSTSWSAHRGPVQMAFFLCHKWFVKRALIPSGTHGDSASPWSVDCWSILQLQAHLAYSINLISFRKNITVMLIHLLPIAQCLAIVSPWGSHLCISLYLVLYLFINVNALTNHIFHLCLLKLWHIGITLADILTFSWSHGHHLWH